MNIALQILIGLAIGWFLVGLNGYALTGNQRIMKDPEAKTPLHWTVWVGPIAYENWLKKYDAR